MTTTVDAINPDHDLIINKVRDGYKQRRYTLIVVTIVTILAIYSIYNTLKDRVSSFNLSTAIAIPISLLLILLAIVVPIVIVRRITEAMLPDMISNKHVLKCASLIEHLDEIALDEVQHKSEAEQGALQTSTLLPNLLWTGIVALIALSDKVKWDTTGGIQIGVIVFIVTLFIAVSSVENVERTQANTVILKAIYQIKSARERVHLARQKAEEALRTKAMLLSLLASSDSPSGNGVVPILPNGKL